MPVQHWYANAYDVELDFGHEAPVNRKMQLKAYDVDDGGSHYVFFMYDAQPASWHELVTPEYYSPEDGSATQNIALAARPARDRAMRLSIGAVSEIARRSQALS